MQTFSDTQQPLVALISCQLFPYFVSFHHSNLDFSETTIVKTLKYKFHLGACLIAIIFLYNHELKEQICVLL